jgi:hypothetical protein
MRCITFKPEYAMVFSENSRISWFHIGEEFKYFLDVRPGSPVHIDSFAHDFFKGIPIPDSFNEVPSHAWTGDSRFTNSSRVMEMSIGSSMYSHVLTFLFVDHEEDDEKSYDDDSDDYEELDGYMRFRK